MKLTPERKSNQITISRHFNQVTESRAVEKKDKEIADKDQDHNFFKTYFTFEEFIDDITVKKRKRYGWDTFNYNNMKEFYEYYKGRDYAELHLNLDSPLLLTFFHKSNKYRHWATDKYEFMCSPNLQEFGFMRVMPAETVYQEIDMFLGNILVKDIMPPLYQSDIDKLTAHGFDPKTSFRKPKKN